MRYLRNLTNKFMRKEETYIQNNKTITLQENVTYADISECDDFKVHIHC